MTLEAILNTIPQLTTRERLLLIEMLRRSLHSDSEPHDTRGSAERLLGIVPHASNLTDEAIDRLRFESVLREGRNDTDRL